jgi:hypothetical protein
MAAPVLLTVVPQAGEEARQIRPLLLGNRPPRRLHGLAIGGVQVESARAAALDKWVR